MDVYSYATRLPALFDEISDSALAEPLRTQLKRTLPRPGGADR